MIVIYSKGFGGHPQNIKIHTWFIFISFHLALGYMVAEPVIVIFDDDACPAQVYFSRQIYFLPSKWPLLAVYA